MLYVTQTAGNNLNLHHSNKRRLPTLGGPDQTRSRISSRSDRISTRSNQNEGLFPNNGPHASVRILLQSSVLYSIAISCCALVLTISIVLSSVQYSEYIIYS